MRALAIFLLLVACDNNSSSGNADLSGHAANCPSKAPNGTCTTPGECDYSDQTCVCDGGFWFCRSSDCPARAAASGACTGSLECDYGFEDTCLCVAGEWLCCGGVAMCPADGVDGTRCCGLPSVTGMCTYDCSAGQRAVCMCNANQLSCTMEACD